MNQIIVSVLLKNFASSSKVFFLSSLAGKSILALNLFLAPGENGAIDLANSDHNVGNLRGSSILGVSFSVAL